MRRTPQERKWLDILAIKVRAGLKRMSGREIVRLRTSKALATDESSDGWYVLLGELDGLGAELYLFIDDVRGKAHRALWYGASAERKGELSVIEEAASVRWPNTQRF